MAADEKLTVIPARASLKMNIFNIVTERNRPRCDACKETLSKKKSTVTKHISSGKHTQAKKAVELSKRKDNISTISFEKLMIKRSTQ